MAMLAAERLRPGAPRPHRNEMLVLGVGIAHQTATEVHGLAQRVMGPPSRLAARTLDWAARQSAGEPVTGGLLARSRARLSRLVLDARTAGEATLSAGRAEADALVRTGVADGIAWAQAQAVPQIVDGMVPHLVDTVMPQLIEGALPEIRARVLPVVIDDLTNDPRLRELVMEQSRGVVGEAAHQVRSATANADDRVETAFRRLVGSDHHPDGPDPVPGPASS